MLKILHSASVSCDKFYRNMHFAPLIMIAVLAGCNQNKPVQQPPLQSLPVITVQTDTITTFKEYPATIEGSNVLEIRPEVDGRIQAIHVDEGAFVQKGTLLFQIDDRQFKEKLNNAKASLHAAQGALSNTKLEVEKLAPLVQNKVISDFQLKAAIAANETAEGNIEQARANVRSAQIDLEYTSLRAPVSGYIGRLNKKVGSLVASKDAQPLTLLSDIDRVHVYFSLGETDFIIFNAAYKGETLDRKLKNLPAVSLVLSDNTLFNSLGRIDMIGGQFDESTGAIALRATFANPSKILRSGNTGKVRLGLLQENVAVIPQNATLEMQDKIFVFTVGDSNRVSKMPIVISGKSGSNFLVSGGIKAGTKIIAAGVEHIQEGERIKPQQASLAAIQNKQ